MSFSAISRIFYLLATILITLIYLPSSCGFQTATMARGLGGICQTREFMLPARQNLKIYDKKGLSSMGDPTQLDSAHSPKVNVMEQVASKGLAGVLAIFVAEAIFWAAGIPLAELWFKFSTGEWVDLSTPEGQLKATAFSFGYGGFATVILQYRVTLFAIPLVPIMEKLIVEPLNRQFGKANKKEKQK